jgi:hypothetical protein
VDRDELDDVWRALDEAISDYERTTGGTVEELLPPDTGELAFRVPGVARARELTALLICNQREKVRPAVQASVMAGVPGVTAALMSVLDLPAESAGIAGTWATVITRSGMEELCADQGEPIDVAQ